MKHKEVVELVERLVFLSKCEKRIEYNDMNVGEELQSAATAITELLDRAESAEKKLAEREPKHGHWAHLGGDEWCCTECGFVITTEGSWEKPIKKYCEECGAKMDEDVPHE